MREIHGVRAMKMTPTGALGQQAITVEDGDQFVVLRLSEFYPAVLTPQEARKIASHLWASARRLERLVKSKEKVL